MIYKYIIIENNKAHAETIQLALAENNKFEGKGTAANIKKAMTLALQENPQLIFLDVELDDGSGFELLKNLKQHTHILPFIIMITDFDKYAKDAVNNDVLYFLDKPLDLDELTIALSKFEKKYLEYYNQIVFKDNKGHHFFNTDDIVYIESNNTRIIVHRESESEPMLITKTMRNMEKILPVTFLRLHRQYIINRNYLKRLNTNEKYVLLKFHGTEMKIPIGEKYLAKTKNQLLSKDLP